MKKLNFGCGSIQPKDWMNVDKDSSFYNGLDENFHVTTKDMPDDSFDIIVAHAVVQQFEWHEMVTELKELCRILKPGGIIRISLPDIDEAINALEKFNRSWFPNTDEKTIEEAFCAWITWYSTSKSLLLPEVLDIKLLEAGFKRAVQLGFKKTTGSEELISLDTREGEFFFMEAWK